MCSLCRFNLQRFLFTPLPPLRCRRHRRCHHHHPTTFLLSPASYRCPVKRLHIIRRVETSLSPPHSHLLLTRFQEKMISLECYCGKLFNQSLVNFSGPLCRRRDKIFIWRWPDGVKTSGWDLSLDMLRVSLPFPAVSRILRKRHTAFYFFFIII